MKNFEIDDELLTCFHQPASLSDKIRQRVHERNY